MEKRKNINPKCEVDIDAPQFLKITFQCEFLILQNITENLSSVLISRFEDYESAYRFMLKIKKLDKNYEILKWFRKNRAKGFAKLKEELTFLDSK